MTATGATATVAATVAEGAGILADNQATRGVEAEEEPSSAARSGNLTAKLIQATTGNVRSLLNRTIATGSGSGLELGTSAGAGGGAGGEAGFEEDLLVSNVLEAPPPLMNGSGSSPLDGQDVYSAFGDGLPGAGNLSGFIESSTSVLSSAMTTLPSLPSLPTLPTLPATSSIASTFQAQTVATFISATGGKNRPTTIVLYPTVSPESIVIPIVSCIFGFPILALIVICCLRRRAKLARERDRRRNYDMQDHAVSLVRFSPIHRLNYRSSRAISLRPERSLSQGFTSLELDTVLEERCSDVEQTQTEILNPESPMDTTSYKMSFSSS
ncbi:hypothetical protein KR018_004360 [Drosophila ironensis]|nr:hypothetical protein KR018_004360 [Drosophila ironensis]